MKARIADSLIMSAARVLLVGLVLVTGTLQSPHPARAESKLPPAVAHALNRAGIPESAVGIYVHEIGAAQPALAVGATRALNPASTMKLVTTYAALELLGPAYTWPTEVLATGPVGGGVLDGDLVLKGSGDPWLTIENFWRLLRDVRSRGVREIRGDLVLDRSYYARAEVEVASFDEDPSRPYNTGPDALLVNFKAVRLSFFPGADGVVRIAVEPPLPEVTVVNRLKLEDGHCGDWSSRMRVNAESDSRSARLVFSGGYAKQCGERTRYYSVLGHPQYTASLFTHLWRELGGSFTGAVREGEAASGTQLLASADSPSAAEIVRHVNKFSNNVMARQVFLTLGAVADGAPATAEKAERAVRGWLKRKGIAAPELVMENGSGLSRLERVSAESLGRILLAAFASPIMPEFVSSLPLTAVDGTMKRRLNGSAVAGHAHIKTGLLRGVRSIAGYVLDARGRRVVVVFIVNHPNYGAAQAAQDALLNWAHQRR